MAASFQAWDYQWGLMILNGLVLASRPGLSLWGYTVLLGLPVFPQLLQHHPTWAHYYCTGLITPVSWSGSFSATLFRLFCRCKRFVYLYFGHSLCFFFLLFSMPRSTMAVTFSHQHPVKLYLPCSPACQPWFILVFQTAALFNNERQISFSLMC